MESFYTIYDNLSSIILAQTLYLCTVVFEVAQLIVSHMINIDPLTSRLLSCTSLLIIIVMQALVFPPTDQYRFVFLFTFIDLFNITQTPLQVRNNITQVIHHENFIKYIYIKWLFYPEFPQGLFDLNLWSFLHTVLQVLLRLCLKNAVRILGNGWACWSFCFLQVSCDGRRLVCCKPTVVLGTGRIRHRPWDLGRRAVWNILQGELKHLGRFLCAIRK